MNPISILLFLAFARGERKDEGGFDKGLLLALALSGQTGQFPGAAGTPAPSPATPGAYPTPPFDPTTLLLLAMGPDLFGPRFRERREELRARREEIAKLVSDLSSVTPTPTVNINVSF